MEDFGLLVAKTEVLSSVFAATIVTNEAKHFINPYYGTWQLKQINK